MLQHSVIFAILQNMKMPKCTQATPCLHASARGNCTKPRGMYKRQSAPETTSSNETCTQQASDQQAYVVD